MRLRAFLLVLPLLVLVLAGCPGYVKLSDACPSNGSRIMLINSTKTGDMVGIATTRDSQPTWLLYGQPSIINTPSWATPLEIYVFVPEVMEGDTLKQDVTYVDRFTVTGISPGTCASPDIVNQVTTQDSKILSILAQRVKAQHGKL